MRVTNIFADFKVEWPEEIKRILNAVAIFSVDISVVSPECAADFTPFQIWLGQTILPVVFGIIMMTILLVVRAFFFVMQETRLPIWARRKFSKRLRPPKLKVASDADSLGERVAKKLINQVR
ncbi:MAG: hypothetical protein SGPRY_007071 [Prymnesium sp.]